MFDFCSLRSEILVDENGILHLCYIFDEREKSGNPLIDHHRENNVKILKDIFFIIFPNCNDEKYIGFQPFSKKDNLKNVLRALFVLVNKLNNVELNNFMLDNDTNVIYEKFKNSNSDADGLFDSYISEISQEFEIIAKKVKDKIFENEILRENSEKMLRFPFINQF